ELYRAAVRAQVASDQIEQRGFAGSVRADDGGDLPRVHAEGDIGHRAKAAEGFAQAGDLKHGAGLSAASTAHKGRRRCRPGTRTAAPAGSCRARTASTA